MIEYPHPKLSLCRQCSLLSVNRGGLSYQPVPADEQTLQIMRRLDEWYTEHPDLGHRRLVVLLKQEGWVVNIKRVRRLRALMGLETQSLRRSDSQAKPVQAGCTPATLFLFATRLGYRPYPSSLGH